MAAGRLVAEHLSNVLDSVRVSRRAAGGVPGTAFAGPESPTYDVYGGGKTSDGNYRYVVMNDDGWGIYVTGSNERKARKAAEKAAEELNQPDADTSECVDVCSQHPELCEGVL